MFGRLSANAMAVRMLQGREDAKNLPRVEVTRAEFIKRMVAAGASEREAGFQATVSAGLGGYTRLGDEMIRVTKSEGSK